MTGGQYSPTTPTGDHAATAPYGNLERSFDIVSLAKAAGAGFAARGDCYHTELTVSLIASGIKHQGFSVIDCASICPTYYGRKNGNVSPVDMLRWQCDNLKPVKCGEQFDGYSIGAAFENEYPEYTQIYEKLLHSLAEGGNET